MKNKLKIIIPILFILLILIVSFINIVHFAEDEEYKNKGVIVNGEKVLYLDSLGSELTKKEFAKKFINADIYNDETHEHNFLGRDILTGYEHWYRGRTMVQGTLGGCPV